MQAFAGSCFVLVACLFAKTHALECYQCSQVDDLNRCNASRTCNTGETCFTNAIPNHQGVQYDLGCIAQSKCSGGLAASGSIVGKRQLECHACCSRDFCNQALCQSIHAASTCQDDEQEDCAKLESLFRICNDVPHARLICPRFCNLCGIVDGGWSDWSVWSDCDVTCANGTQSRTRFCNNPVPSPRGEQCKGLDREDKICTNRPCPVHGGWTRWSEWGSCSVTCDIGMQRRDRSCSNPFPSADGDFCRGEARDDRMCIESACANGAWSTWSVWSICSVTCGTGLQSRHRQCDNPKPSPFGSNCIGSSENVNICFEQACDAGGWANWNSWSGCSVTCGGGIRSRSRTCTNPFPSGQGQYCVGDSSVVQTCNNNRCPGTPTVVFKARSPNHLSLDRGDTLIFTTNMLNYGDGYDNTTGIFTAPVTGTYLFTFQLCVNPQKGMFYGLVYNDIVHTSGVFYDADYTTCYTADGMLLLNAGHKVWIKCLHGSSSNVLYEHSSATNNFWNTFSGMLIHT